MFAYYAKWISSFADKVRPLVKCKSFSVTDSALKSFELLKTELAKAALRSADESLPFSVECDASDSSFCDFESRRAPRSVHVSNTSRKRRHYPAFKKVATAIIEAVRKWSHLLSRNTYTLITDQ